MERKEVLNLVAREGLNLAAKEVLKITPREDLKKLLLRPNRVLRKNIEFDFYIRFVNNVQNVFQRVYIYNV